MAARQQGQHLRLAATQRDGRGLLAEISQRVAESSRPPLAVQPLCGGCEAGRVGPPAEQPLQAGDVPCGRSPSHRHTLDQVPRRVREELVQDRPGEIGGAAPHRRLAENRQARQVQRVPRQGGEAVRRELVDLPGRLGGAAGRRAGQGAHAAQRDQTRKARHRMLDVVLEFGQSSRGPVNAAELPDPIGVCRRQAEAASQGRRLVCQFLGLVGPPGEDGQQPPVDQHPPALQRIAACLADRRHLLHIGCGQADRAELVAVGHQPLVRAEAQILIAEAGGDVEYGRAGRQSLVQEVGTPQGELPGDQGRAQRFGVIGLFSELHRVQAGASALVPAAGLPVRGNCPPGQQPRSLPGRDVRAAAGPVEQSHQVVVRGHLGDRVPDRERAGRQGYRVTGAVRLRGGRLEACTGGLDPPGQQQAPAQPHLQTGVDVVAGRQGDGHLPPGGRVLPGQQAVRRFSGGACGVGGDLVADLRPRLDGVMSEVSGLPPADVTQRGKHPGVQVRTPGWGKLLLHCIADQRMDKTVGTRTRPVRADQPGVHRRIESRHRAGRADPHGSGQGRVVEVAAKDRRYLQRFPAVSRKWRQPLADDLPDAAQRRTGRCARGQQADALGDEQRVTAGAGVKVAHVDAVHTRRTKPLRHALFAQSAKLTRAAAPAVGQAGDHAGSQRPGRHFSGAVGHDHAYRHWPYGLAQIGQQPQ